MLRLYGKYILNQSINPLGICQYRNSDHLQHKRNQQGIEPDLTKQGDCPARSKAPFHPEIPTDQQIDIYCHKTEGFQKRTDEPDPVKGYAKRDQPV